VSLALRDRARIAKMVASNAAAVPGVAGVSAGSADASTYFPGGRQEGVIVRDEVVEVHLVVASPAVALVAARVRQKVEQALATAGVRVPVDVVVEDIDLEQLDPWIAGPEEHRGLGRPGQP
jgi:hypothetical protein